MAQIPQADFERLTVDRLLSENKFADALELVSKRLADQPRDREASLYWILANVHARGPERYEREIDNLRQLFNLNDVEKDLVRRIFLLGFHAAEKAGLERKTWAYQRLLRRLLIGQLLDQPIPISEAPVPQLVSDAAIEHVPSRSAPRLEDTANSTHRTPRRVKLFPDRDAKRSVALALAAAGLLITPIAYIISSTETRTAQRTRDMTTVTQAEPILMPRDPKENPDTNRFTVNTASNRRTTLTQQRSNLSFSGSIIEDPISVSSVRHAPTSPKSTSKKLTGRPGPVPSNSEGQDRLALVAKTQEEPALPEDLSVPYKTRRRVSLREAPRFAAASVQEIDVGTQIRVLAMDGDWLKVKTQRSGITGYVRREYVAPSTVDQ